MTGVQTCALPILGRPRLFFGISAGSMDSMVNKYTANKRLRREDAYTPDGRPDMRPQYPWFWFLYALSVSPMPVSYTHLDVYKRQNILPTNACAAKTLIHRTDARICARNILLSFIAKFWKSYIPVSYTHLDVYKRQTRRSLQHVHGNTLYIHALVTEVLTTEL